MAELLVRHSLCRQPLVLHYVTGRDGLQLPYWTCDRSDCVDDTQRRPRCPGGHALNLMKRAGAKIRHLEGVPVWWCPVCHEAAGASQEHEGPLSAGPPRPQLSFERARSLTLISDPRYEERCAMDRHADGCPITLPSRRARVDVGSRALGFHGPYWSASEHFSVECARAYLGFAEECLPDAIDVPQVDGDIVPRGATSRSAAWNAISTAERNAIEALGMARAREYFEQHGWRVVDVSANSPYDLHCARSDGAERHVEVKATTATGERVLVTRNEVEHAQESGHAALALVHGVELHGDPQTPTATGGTLLVIDPWTPDPEALTPIAFSYAVPLPCSLADERFLLG